MRRFWWRHEEKIIFGGMVIAIIGIVVLAFIAQAADEASWREFVKEHNCRIIGKTSDSFGSGVGIASNGQAVVTNVYIPGKTGYQCDDGMQYWR